MRLGGWGWGVSVACVIAGLAARVVLRSVPEPDSIEAADARREASPLIRFETLASGFSEPVDLQFVPGAGGLAVVLEKQGRARLVQLPLGDTTAAPHEPAAPAAELLALDVRSSSELGLLGWAFHPRYLENGLFYLNDNPRDAGPLRTRISEWHLPVTELGKQPPQLRRVLLEIEQPFQNHDGGQLAFGPDGYLYIGMGDGGSRADPYGNGQNLGTLLGKMLRIDVDAQPGY